MNRRTFLETTAVLLATERAQRNTQALSGRSTPLRDDELSVIETRLCTLRLNRSSGNLVGIAWKDPRLEIIREPRLGENFRILLPRTDCEANYFLSSNQTVEFEQIADGVVCHYNSLRNSRETIQASVHYQIQALEDHVEFSIHIENPTDLPLAEVYFAIVGGQQGLQDRRETESLVPGLNLNLAPGLFTRFHAGNYGGGNLGIRYEAAGFTYPGLMQMGWIEFYNSKAGLGMYYANHDPEPRLTGLYFELHPFAKSAVTEDNWPTAADVPPGEPIGLTMGWMKFPFTRKSTFSSGPVALQVHRGDWHEGSQLYRHWFDQYFPVRRAPSWLRKEMAWQSVIISNCEDVIVHRFNELPKLAADAKKYHVTTFEILGWDMGGIDRGYPQYRPNPRLGSAREFRQALAEMKAMGVHPLIFANIDVADTALPLFRDTLHEYEVMGRWAPDLVLMGWGEGTNVARMGLTQHNMTLVSPAHPEFRKFEVDQFIELVKEGADGFQLDKSDPLPALDFNPRLGTSPDRSLPEGALTILKEILERCREVNPDFALASEIFWDRSFPIIDVSYVRMNDIDMPSPALRYTFPEWTSTICAESPGDFNVVNNGMRYGLVWAMQPRHYNDSMDEPLTRPLSEYVREMIRIRSKHKELLFHGRFQDTLGAQVTGGKDVRYSVFEGLEKPGKACVVVNYADQQSAAHVSSKGAQGRTIEILRPFQPDTVGKLPLDLTLRPHSCAVIVVT